jgi:hypothetical protein
VKGAKAGVVLACMTQIHTGLSNKVHKIYAGFDFVSDGHGRLIIGLVAWNGKLQKAAF